MSETSYCSVNFYEILGVKENSDARKIRSAYRKLLKVFHPDLNPNDAFAEKITKEINEAYRILGNQVLRADYDRARRENAVAAGQKEFHRREQEEMERTTREEEQIFRRTMIKQKLVEIYFEDIKRRFWIVSFLSIWGLFFCASTVSGFNGIIQTFAVRNVIINIAYGFAKTLVCMFLLFPIYVSFINDYLRSLANQKYSKMKW